MSTTASAPTEVASRAKIGAVDLAYTLTGKPGKTPVMMIMGFMMPGRAWRFIVPELAADRQVCTFDNRGAGESSVPGEAWTMADMAGDVRDLMDHLGWDKAHIVGVSMGGMIAQVFALDYTDRAASLTLIATHAGGRFAIVPPLGGLVPFVRANLLSRVKDPEGVRRRYRALSKLLFTRSFLASNEEAHLEALLRHDFEPAPPADGKKAQLGAIMKHRTASRLKGLSGLATLIIKPAADLLVSPSHSERLHRMIPGSRLVTIEDAGHGLVRQVPGNLAREIHAHIVGAEPA